MRNGNVPSKYTLYGSTVLIQRRHPFRISGANLFPGRSDEFVSAVLVAPCDLQSRFLRSEAICPLSAARADGGVIPLQTFREDFFFLAAAEKPSVCFRRLGRVCRASAGGKRRRSGRKTGAAASSASNRIRLGRRRQKTEGTYEWGYFWVAALNDSPRETKLAPCRSASGCVSEREL